MRLAGVILAGGRSSRMEGRDKALLALGGKTLAARACDRLARQVATVALSFNDDPRRLSLPGVAVVADADDSRAGPLAGILAGLRWASPRCEALASVAVDTPFFPPDLVRRLAAAAPPGAPPGAIVVAASAGRRHPTFALWPVGIADALAAYLAGGGRKAGAFIDAHAHVAVDFPATHGFDPFFNVNTPADFAEAEEILRRLETAVPMR